MTSEELKEILEELVSFRGVEHRETIDAVNDAHARISAALAGWRPIETVPLHVPVLLKTTHSPSIMEAYFPGAGCGFYPMGVALGRDGRTKGGALGWMPLPDMTIHEKTRT